MTAEFVDFLCHRMEEARRSAIDNMPLLYLRNPTPTRVRIERARRLAPKIIRYRKTKSFAEVGTCPTEQKSE